MSLARLLRFSAVQKVPIQRGFFSAAKTLEVTFNLPDGTEKKLKASPGDTLLEVAHENDIDIEGACGGEAACSTCFVHVNPDYYDKLPAISEAEQDMLDLVNNSDDNGRLCCQVVMEKKLDGISVRLPNEVFNMMR